MDDALVLPGEHSSGIAQLVLILVLMDDALVPGYIDGFNGEGESVLILVLMDDALVLQKQL